MREALPVTEAPSSTDASCALPSSPLAQVQAGIDACVHCGFCLQACPTYLALEDENDKRKRQSAGPHRADARAAGR